MAEKWTPELLAARLPANELYAGQITPRSHRVRKGETMAAIAQRYGMTATRLAEMNGLSANASLRAGRHLTLPEQLPRTLGGAAPTAAVVAAENAAPSPANATRQALPWASSTSFVVAIHSRALLRVSACRRPNCSR
jgi:LysM repeat protein